MEELPTAYFCCCNHGCPWADVSVRPTLSSSKSNTHIDDPFIDLHDITASVDMLTRDLMLETHAALTFFTYMLVDAESPKRKKKEKQTSQLPDIKRYNLPL